MDCSLTLVERVEYTIQCSRKASGANYWKTIAGLPAADDGVLTVDELTMGSSEFCLFSNLKFDVGCSLYYFRKQQIRLTIASRIGYESFGNKDFALKVSEWISTSHLHRQDRAFRSLENC